MTDLQMLSIVTSTLHGMLRVCRERGIEADRAWEVHEMAEQYARRRRIEQERLQGAGVDEDAIQERGFNSVKGRVFG